MDNKIGDLLELLLKAGQMLLESGAETYRAETTVAHMFNSFENGKIDVFALATTITVSIYHNNQHHSSTRRIQKRNIDLNKIEQVNAVSRKISAYELDISEAMGMLNKIDREDTRKRSSTVYASGVAAGMFSVLMGGGLFEFFMAGLYCSIVLWLSTFVRKTMVHSFIMRFLGGLVPAFLSTTVHYFISLGNVEVITLGAMLPLFPGIAMVNAIRDTINGDLVSGVARSAEALVTALSLALGALIGFSVGVFF